MPSIAREPVFARRLREARLATDLSQRRLGIAAGLEPSIASARINRYERGTHEPTANVSAKLGEALGVPVAFFFAEDDRLAEAVRLFAGASKRRQDEVLRLLRGRRRRT